MDSSDVATKQKGHSLKTITITKHNNLYIF